MTEYIEKILQDKKKLIAAALILAFILYVDFAIILKGRFSQLGALGPKITKLKKDIKQLDKDLSSLETAGVERRQIEEKIEKVTERIPSEEKITQILDVIAKVANEREVKIMQIRPSQPSSAVKAKRAVKSTVSEKISPLLISLDMLCGYHQLGRFINDLENGDIFIEVEELHIKPDPNEYLKEKISLTLRTYVKK